MLRLIEPTSGRVVFDGIDVTGLKKRELRKLRPRMQMIFQDPDSSLDPRMKIGESIAEPLRLRGSLKKGEIKERVSKLVETVGLNPEHINRYPYQMSGGQNQRVVLARVLAANLRFVVADEPTSGLDVSVQAQILHLMNELKRELDLTTIFITHDLEVARYVSDRVAVMYGGRILEIGRTEDIFSRPRHPYTRLLLNLEPTEGALFPEEENGGNGRCPFHPRYPLAKGACRRVMPKMVEVGPDHRVLCSRV